MDQPEEENKTNVENVIELENSYEKEEDIDI